MCVLYIHWLFFILSLFHFRNNKNFDKLIQLYVCVPVSVRALNQTTYLLSKTIKDKLKFVRCVVALPNNLSFNENEIFSCLFI